MRNLHRARQLGPIADHAPGHYPYFLRRNIDRADALAEALSYHGGEPESEHFA